MSAAVRGTKKKKRARLAEADLKDDGAAADAAAAALCSLQKQLEDSRALIAGLKRAMNPDDMRVHMTKLGFCFDCDKRLMECSTCRDVLAMKRFATLLFSSSRRAVPPDDTFSDVLTLLLRTHPDQRQFLRFDSLEADVASNVIWSLVKFTHYPDAKDKRSLRWLIELLHLGAGLTLDTPTTGGFTSEGEPIGGQSSICATVIRNQDWVMMHALLDAIPGQVPRLGAEGRSTVAVAAEHSAPPELVGRILQRTSVDALNDRRGTKSGPLYAITLYALQLIMHRLRRHFDGTDRLECATACVKLLCDAAESDGSGLDVFTQRPVVEELLRADGEEGVAYVYTRSAYDAAIAPVLRLVVGAAERVATYRLSLIPSLRAAMMPVLLPIDDVVLMVGEYIAPRFEELRAAAATGLVTHAPVALKQTRPAAAAAAAAAADTDAGMTASA